MTCVTGSAIGWRSPSRCIDWHKLWGMTHWILPRCTFKERSKTCNRLSRQSHGPKAIIASIVISGFLLGVHFIVSSVAFITIEYVVSYIRKGESYAEEAEILLGPRASYSWSDRRTQVLSS